MEGKRFTVDDDGIYDNQEKKHFKFIAYDWIDCDIYECCEKLNDQSETIRKQSIRIYCQDKEIQRLLGELEKIPKSIREVWLEE